MGHTKNADLQFHFLLRPEQDPFLVGVPTILPMTITIPTKIKPTTTNTIHPAIGATTIQEMTIPPITITILTKIKPTTNQRTAEIMATTTNPTTIKPTTNQDMATIPSRTTIEPMDQHMETIMATTTTPTTTTNCTMPQSIFLINHL